MKNLQENINQYVGAWNKKSEEEIRYDLEQSCAAQITYTDKNVTMTVGIDALMKLVISSHKMIPGRIFSVFDHVESFDNHATFRWGLNIPEKGDFLGRDYLQYDENNLITKIIGFVPSL